MADLQTKGGNGRFGHRTPRVDLTPMVDLGFLLITFFMYTTTLASPHVMQLAVPPRDNSMPGPAIAASRALTLIPASGHRLAYYQGLPSADLRLRWCDRPADLRRLINQESARIAVENGGRTAGSKGLFVFIKPDTGAHYNDVVNCLDEMTINGVHQYTLAGITRAEQDAVKTFSAH